MAATRGRGGWLAHTWRVGVATCLSWSADRASMWSASLAFYSMLSLGPLLWVAAALGGLWVGQEAARQAIVAQVAATIGAQGAAAAQSMMAAAWSQPRGGAATWTAAATLVFGASGVFSALQDAVDAIWHVAPRPSGGPILWLRRRFASLAMVAGVGFLSAVSLVVSASLAAVEGWLAHLMPSGRALVLALDAGVNLACFSALFAAIFKVLPDARVAWRDVWAGGLVTSVLFTLGRGLLALYLRHMHPDSPFGAASSLAALLIWVYYAAQIFFLGAAWVRADLHMRGRIVEPSADAVPVRTIAAEPPHRPAPRQAGRVAKRARAGHARGAGRGSREGGEAGLP